MFVRKSPMSDHGRKPTGPDAGRRIAGPATDGLLPTPRRPDIPSLAAMMGGESKHETPAAKPTNSCDLLVGQGIALKIEVDACDLLVVEGRVESSMKCGTLRLNDGGEFVGECEVDKAEIAGRFDGTLVVNDRLVVLPTGRISGAVRYRRVEISPGGEIKGQMEVMPAAEEAVPADAVVEETAPEPSEKVETEPRRAADGG